MTYLIKRLALKADNVFFSNKYINKTIYSSKASFMTNKNSNLMPNQRKYINLNNKFILKNINKKYIEEHILNKNNSFKKYFFNAQFYKDNIENNNDEKKASKNISLKYKYFKNINFQELIYSNDINFNDFNFKKHKQTNINNNKKFRTLDYITFNNQSYCLKNQQKKLSTTKYDYSENPPKKILLKKLKINDKYKKINLANNDFKTGNNSYFNKYYKNISNDSIIQLKPKEISEKNLFSRITISRNKSESNFYNRLKKNSYNKTIFYL